MRGGSMHRGIDFAASLGTPILAAADGVVVEARSGVSGFGCWIWIRHTVLGKPVDTIYGHMYIQDLLVKTGDRVKKGQQISRVGNNGQSSGPHLHFEVWPGNRVAGASVDPADWIGLTS